VATATDIVDVPAPGAAIEVGLKLTVRPFAEPPTGGVIVADNVIAASNGPEMAVVIFDVPLEPRSTVSEVGEADIAKFGGAVTVKVTFVVLVTPPPVPVTVIVYVPVAVVEPTAKVRVEVPAPGSGIGLTLKLTFTVLGWPEAVSVTAASKPVAIVLVITGYALEPCATETEEGDAERVKFRLVTTRLNVVVFVMPLPDPTTVMVYVPMGIVVGVFKVNVELPDPGAGIVMGSKVAVTPVGRPVADNVIAPSNPPVRVAATVVVAAPPCATETELGEVERLKFAPGGAVLERTSSRPAPFGLPQPVAKS